MSGYELLMFLMCYNILCSVLVKEMDDNSIFWNCYNVFIMFGFLVWSIILIWI